MGLSSRPAYVRARAEGLQTDPATHHALAGFARVRRAADSRHAWLVRTKAIITPNRSYHTLRLIVPISYTFSPR